MEVYQAAFLLNAWVVTATQAQLAQRAASGWEWRPINAFSQPNHQTSPAGWAKPCIILCISNFSV